MGLQYHQTVLVRNTFPGFHQMVKPCFNDTMTTEAEARRANLRRLVQDRAGGNVTRFGALVGKQQSYISDLLAGRKAFGEKVARQIEAKLALKRGWLDAPANQPAPPDPPPAIAEHPARFTGALTPKQSVMILLMESLTAQQQDELIRHAQERADENTEVITQLTSPARTGTDAY